MEKAPEPLTGKKRRTRRRGASLLWKGTLAGPLKGSMWGGKGVRIEEGRLLWQRGVLIS